jgi:hypothetical protein
VTPEKVPSVQNEIYPGKVDQQPCKPKKADQNRAANSPIPKNLNARAVNQMNPGGLWNPGMKVVVEVSHLTLCYNLTGDLTVMSLVQNKDSRTRGE